MVHLPGSAPHFTMIRQVTASPVARGNGRQALINSRKGAPREIVARLIPEQSQITLGMPDPFSAAAKAFERNDPGAQLRHDSRFEVAVPEHMNGESLLAPDRCR